MFHFCQIYLIVVLSPLKVDWVYVSMITLSEVLRTCLPLLLVGGDVCVWGGGGYHRRVNVHVFVLFENAECSI